MTSDPDLDLQQMESSRAHEYIFVIFHAFQARMVSLELNEKKWT